MATASDVAKYFLTLSQPEDGDLLSNLKLQKLVYYAQGFHIALHGRPLFDEPIVAWQYGPVVESLYREYKDSGSSAIEPPREFDAGMFSSNEKDVLNEVWNVYGQFSAWKLRDMTHQEGPWKETPKNGVIDREAMRSYFLTQLEDR